MAWSDRRSQGRHADFGSTGLVAALRRIAKSMHVKT
jgi:hypothetical protein